MLGYLAGTHGIQPSLSVRLLRQCLFSSHPRCCGSISSNSGLLHRDNEMVARCVRGFAGEWAGNSHV